MGKRGSRPTPTRLKVLRGNPGRRPLAGAPRVRALLRPPPCPPSLRGEERVAWRRLARALVERGILTELDEDALEVYCAAYGRWLEARRLVAERGAVYVTPQARLRERPEVSVAEGALKTMRAFGAELGLTPHSRSALGLPGPEEPDDGFAEFLARRPGL